MGAQTGTSDNFLHGWLYTILLAHLKLLCLSKHNFFPSSLWALIKLWVLEVSIIKCHDTAAQFFTVISQCHFVIIPEWLW